MYEYSFIYWQRCLSSKACNDQALRKFNKNMKKNAALAANIFVFQQQEKNDNRVTYSECWGTPTHFALILAY